MTISLIERQIDIEERRFSGVEIMDGGDSMDCP
jgi:hypothetical protein